MLIRSLLWLSLWNWSTYAQSFQIEDIPIEHYGHEDHQNDEIDVELMPRSARFLKNEPDDLSFHESEHIKQYFIDLTAPDVKTRPRRSSKDPLKVVEELGKPLELLVIDIKNITEDLNGTTGVPKEETATAQAQRGERMLNDKQFLINDFIRFKRAAQKKSDQKVDFRGTPTGGKFVQANPQGSIGHYDNLTPDDDRIKDNNRETRGVTKEQWVKQPLPDQRADTVFEENVQSSSDSLRAPRVNFVTNNMQDRDPLDYKFNRQARSRSLNKYSPADLSAEMDYYQPRFARNYMPRDRPYDRQSSRDAYRPDYPEDTRNFIPDYNRKRRIIYYATLPDLSRNSRDDDYRPPFDRYGLGDRYDDRYYQDRYSSYRRRYYEPRYDERSREPAYPVKVTTDVKVREVKKNPERRIYSDVDRTRYNAN